MSSTKSSLFLQFELLRVSSFSPALVFSDPSQLPSSDGQFDTVLLAGLETAQSHGQFEEAVTLIRFVLEHPAHLQETEKFL
ncbi:MAG: hypothetical protein IH589_06410 [Anaerolineales bacterium]|nr:hypothetical protein [Anaerolineales bacterium]